MRLISLQPRGERPRTRQAPSVALDSAGIALQHHHHPCYYLVQDFVTALAEAEACVASGVLPEGFFAEDDDEPDPNHKPKPHPKPRARPAAKARAGGGAGGRAGGEGRRRRGDPSAGRGDRVLRRLGLLPPAGSPFRESLCLAGARMLAG